MGATRREFLRRGGAGLATVAAVGMRAVTGRAQGGGPALDAARALALARDRRDELIDLLSRLVAVPSPLGESAAEGQRIVGEYLEAHGYAAETVVDDPTQYVSHPDYMAPAVPYPAPATNLVGRPRARASRVGLFAHIDTERAGAGWTGDPLRARVRDGRLYGLGAADDKGGVAAMLVASAILPAEGRPSPIVLSLHGKGGGSRGSLPTFARLRDLSQVLTASRRDRPRLVDIKHVVRGVLDLRVADRLARPAARDWQPDSAPLPTAAARSRPCWP